MLNGIMVTMETIEDTTPTAGMEIMEDPMDHVVLMDLMGPALDLVDLTDPLTPLREPSKEQSLVPLWDN